MKPQDIITGKKVQGLNPKLRHSFFQNSEQTQLTAGGGKFLRS
jgi:hypothetical protein